MLDITGIYASQHRKNIKLVQDAGGVLYLDARKADGTGLPTNSPLTSPWVDLSGNDNSATPTNMAGTAASGADITDPAKPFWQMDGSNDHFAMVSSATLDITASPLSVFVVVRFGATISNQFIVAKNYDSEATMQYGIYIESTGRVKVNLEGEVRVQLGTGTVAANKTYEIGFIWDGAYAKLYINGIVRAVAAYSGTLTSRQYLHIGCRSKSIDGATKYNMSNAGIAVVTVYTGSNYNRILKAQRAIRKGYIADDILLVGLGDSLMAGYYATTEGNRFISLLRGLVEAEWGKNVFLQTTSAYGGTIQGALDNLAAINRYSADVIVVEYGTNDCNEENAPAFETKLNQLIDGLTSKSRIVLVTRWLQLAKGDPYDVVIKKVASERKLTVVDIRSIWEDDTNYLPAGVVTYLGESDGWHPNDAGHLNIATAIFNEIQDMY